MPDTKPPAEVPMKSNDEVWFVVADVEHARLLRGRPTEFGHLHVDEVDRFSSNFAPGEHHRPDRLGPSGRSTSVGHEREERFAHSARELSAWLAQAVASHALVGLPVFAPSHLLGALQKEAPKGLASVLREHASELAGLSLHELARHPRIGALRPILA